MKKVLFVATVVRLHINMFHKPFIKWFHDQGWQVDVAANNDYENKEECLIPYCDNFYCLPFERSPLKKKNMDAYRQLKYLIDNNDYDIIHCHTPVGGVATRVAVGKARKNGTKVIYTAHGFHFYKGAPVINWLIYYPVERILAHRTDLLITMNQEDYGYAQKFKAKKVALVNGVGLELNKFKEITLPAYIEAILNIVISVVLVRKFGLIGVAIGTIVGMTYRMIFHVYYTSRIVPERVQSIFYRKLFLFSAGSVIGFVICHRMLPFTNITVESWVVHAVLYCIVIGIILFGISLLFFKQEMKFFAKYIRR